MAPREILRRPQVETRTGLSRSTIYARIQEGTFPSPIPLGARAVGWLASDIDAWIERQVATRSEQAPKSDHYRALAVQSAKARRGDLNSGPKGRTPVVAPTGNKTA